MFLYGCTIALFMASQTLMQTLQDNRKMGTYVVNNKHAECNCSKYVLRSLISFVHQHLFILYQPFYTFFILLNSATFFFLVSIFCIMRCNTVVAVLITWICIVIDWYNNIFLRIMLLCKLADAASLPSCQYFNWVASNWVILSGR